MGKILAAFIAVLAVIASCDIKTDEKRIFADSDKDVTVYVGSASSTATMKVISYGDYPNGYDDRRVLGSSVHGCDEEYVSDLIDDLGAKEVFFEDLGDVLCVYYYSPRIRSFKTINGKKVNLQTAKRNEKYSVGCPMIFGGY